MRISSNYVIAGAIAGIAISAHAVGSTNDIAIYTTLRNALHVPAFALLTAAFFMLFRRNTIFATSLRGAIAASILVSALAESIQSAIGRTASIQDLLLDGLGITFFSVFALLLRSKDNQEGISFVKISILLLFVAIMSLPIIRTTRIIVEAAASPNVTHFQQPWAVKLLRPIGGAIMDSDAPPIEWPATDTSLLQVYFSANKYSGVSIDVLNDWSAYDYLLFTTAAADNRTYIIEIRIHDKTHNGAYSDRYNAKFEVSPVPRTERISIEDIKSGPQGRKLDLESIKAISIFLTDSPGNGSILLGNIELHTR